LENAASAAETLRRGALQPPEPCRRLGQAQRGQIGGEQPGEGLQPSAFVAGGRNIGTLQRGNTETLKAERNRPRQKPVTWLQITPLLFYLPLSSGGLFSLAKF